MKKKTKIIRAWAILDRNNKLEIAVRNKKDFEYYIFSLDKGDKIVPCEIKLLTPSAGRRG